MRGLRYIPSLILVVVALNQLVLTHRAGLSPWSGGGFGMFSTTDAGGTRHLHAFSIRPGIEREVHPPRPLADLTRRVLTAPTESNLRALAMQIANVPTPDDGPATTVRIQVWKTRFDPDTLAPSSHILRALEVALEAH